VKANENYGTNEIKKCHLEIQDSCLRGNFSISMSELTPPHSVFVLSIWW